MEDTSTLAEHLAALRRLQGESPYVPSFDASRILEDASYYEEAKAFFEFHGFIIASNVFSPEEANASVTAMWDIIESHPESEGLHRDDPRSWSNYKASGNYGLSMRGPSFHPVLVNNRQSPKLLHMLSLALGIPEDDVMVSHDRFTVYRATKPRVATESGEKEELDGSSFRTGPANLHIDMNLWWYLETLPESIKDKKSQDHLASLLAGIEKSLPYNDPQDLVKENNLIIGSMGRHVQCVMNFADNLAEDGGTLVVPGFVQHWRKFCEIYRPILKKHVNLPFLTLPKDIEESYMQHALRISMRAGSVLIWNQVTLHGTTPNHSSSCRFAQYLKAFSRKSVYQPNDTTIDRFYRRSTLIQRCLRENGISIESDDKEIDSASTNPICNISNTGTLTLGIN